MSLLLGSSHVGGERRNGRRGVVGSVALAFEAHVSTTAMC